DDGLPILPELLAVIVVSADFAVDPAQRGFVGRKRLDELRPRHAALVDDEILDLAFDLANVVDLGTNEVAQPLDLPCRKADLHELALHLLLMLEILRRLVAFLLQNDQHAREMLADRGEMYEARDLEALQI